MNYKNEFPLNNKKICLGMLGMVEGNGHPYSWSSIINGYNKEWLLRCPFSTIRDYLLKQPDDTIGIDNVEVTHIWTDNLENAKKIAKTSLISKVVKTPEDVIGKVDAVIIPTDIGHEHVKRCRIFVEEGIPIFVDKPMVDNKKDLNIFNEWIANGAKIMSSSCMRYCKEFKPFRMSTHNLGEIKFASITTPKSWSKYGIHALEGIYPILGPGFISARNTGSVNKNIVHFKHKSGTDVVIAGEKDMYGAFGILQLCGSSDYAVATFNDSFFSFKSQLLAFIKYLRTGKRPFPFEETIELMKMLIASIKSRQNGGNEVFLEEINI